MEAKKIVSIDGEKWDFMMEWMRARLPNMPPNWGADDVGYEISLASAAYDAIEEQCLIDEGDESVDGESVSMH